MNLKFKVKESAKHHAKMQITGCVGIIEESNVVTSKAEMLEGKEHNISSSNEVLPEDRLDVNKDGVLDVADLALVAYYYYAKANTPEWEIAKCADVNNDGEVNITDLSLIAHEILGK